MSDNRILTAEQARVLPWRNGGGFTREWLIEPPSASIEKLDFDWRISAAAVNDDGPFSRFPGYQRVLILTSGNGLILTHGDEAPIELRRGTVHHFAGGVPSHARLLDGPVEDFNVIYRAERVRIEADWVRHEARMVSATPLRLFVLVLAGTCELDGQHIAAGSAWSGSLASFSTLNAQRGEAILVRAHPLGVTMRP
jgi:environmental stress-induced protein Ves